MNGFNVLDWTGGAFLLLYAVLYLACLLAGRTIAGNVRPQGHAARLADPDEAALLASGRERVGEVIAARLLDRGALLVERGKLHPVAGHAPADATEAAVLSLPPPISWRAMRRVTDDAASDIDHRLQRRGLLMEQGEAWRLGLLSSLPLLALLLLGLAKAIVGAGRGHPIGFLLALMVLTVITVAIRVFASSRLTQAGISALAEVRSSSARLKLAHTSPETAMAVALFGTGVLAATSIGDFHRLRQSGADGGGGGSDTGSSDSDSSDGGGSGCGGGGCGGCGG